MIVAEYCHVIVNYVRQATMEIDQILYLTLSGTVTCLAPGNLD